jgi:antitoxin VapB
MEKVRAKVFTNGGSQAVRLPKKFRVHTKEVEVWREGEEIRMTPIEEDRTEDWREFFEELDKLGFDMTMEDRNQPPMPPSRAIFDDDEDDRR